MSTMLARPPEARLTARPSGPLRGTVDVPGDKSISHRALIRVVPRCGRWVWRPKAAPFLSA